MNIDVVGDELGIEGVAEVNENTALGVKLKGEEAEPKFGKPVVVNLLPNTDDAENAEPDPVAELDMGEKGGTATVTKVELEPAEENKELALKGLPKDADTTAELATLCEFKPDGFSDGLCVNTVLLFPGWVCWFPENIVGSVEADLEIF